MVRRVGFGSDDADPRRAELSQRYHRVDGNHSEQAHDPQDQPEKIRQPQSQITGRGKRKKFRFLLFIILAIWLAMLSKAILDILVEIRYDYDNAYLIFLVFAIPGWIFLFSILRNMLRRLKG